MLLHIEHDFSQSEINQMVLDECRLRFLNRAVKHDGLFAYAKNGMRLRAW